MPKIGRGSQKLTESKIRDLTPPERGESTIWDGEIKGLGVRIRATGAGGRQPAKTFILKYRNRAGQQRKLTLGDWVPAAGAEPGNLKAMRGRAKVALGQVEQGADPAGAKQAERQAGTVTELADQFLERYVAPHCKPSTAAEYRRLIERRIKPALGPLLVAGLNRAELARFHSSMSDAPRSANQALDIASGMLGCAEEWGLRPEGSNPCGSITKFPEKKRSRVLSDAELRRLGATLDQMESDRAIMPGEANAVRLLALTGCRLSEVLLLEWSRVDLSAGALTLGDSKVGARVHAIGRPAVALLRRLYAKRESEIVLDGNAPGEPVSVADQEVAWRRLRKRAGLEDVRMHDLRHTVATRAAETGASAFLIQDKLGHAGIQQSSEYVARMVAPLRQLSNRVESRISAAMSGRSGKIVKMKRKKTAAGATG